MAKQIAEAGSKAVAVQTDVTDRARVAAVFDAAAAAHGSVDIHVNVAGFGFNSLIVDMAEEDWDSVLGVNLKSQFRRQPEPNR